MDTLYTITAHNLVRYSMKKRSDRASLLYPPLLFTHFLMKYGIFLHGEPLVFKPSRSYHLGSWKTSVQEASRGKGVATGWGRWAFILTSTIAIRRHMEMLMLLDDILVLSSLSCKRQGIWYCIESIAIDRARVVIWTLRSKWGTASLREVPNYCMLQRPLRLTEANWATGLPCDIVEDYQSIIEALCKAVNLAAMSMELVMRMMDNPTLWPREDQERNIVLWRGQKIGNMDLVQFLRLLV